MWPDTRRLRPFTQTSNQGDRVSEELQTMADTFEEQYLDVLQNIEFAIGEVYRAHPELTDWNTEKVIEGLIRGYQAEVKGRRAPALKLSDLEQVGGQTRLSGLCQRPPSVTWHGCSMTGSYSND